MKRKWIIFVASCSLAVLIILPIVTVNPDNAQSLIETLGHGLGGL